MDSLGFTIDVRGGGGNGESDVEERLRVVEDKIRRDMRDIIDVLRVDLPLFLRRAVKERFVGGPDAADRLTDAQLKALKADVDAAGAQALEEILPGLEDEGIWFVDAAPPQGERRDLAANREVHARLQRVGTHLRRLLEKYGFPALTDDDFAEPYKLPTWFIAGKLLLSTVESYWRNIEEMKGLKEAIRSIRDRDQRTKRGERWDSI